jgi:hypothetical protein
VLIPRPAQSNCIPSARADRDIFLCYRPPEDSPPVDPHVNSASEVSFSSFNSIAKLNEETVKVWAKILAAVPGSKLVIKSASLDYPDTVDRVLDCFVRNGVAPGRVELRAWISQREQHLKLYDSIDIALDTFPYNGTTTTCEALWMGVPWYRCRAIFICRALGRRFYGAPGCTSWSRKMPKITLRLQSLSPAIIPGANCCA